jgi:hypothetical protein
LPVLTGAQCLDHLLIMSARQLHRVTNVHPEQSRRGYVTFFDAVRPHQGIQQKIPEKMGSSIDAKREGKIIAFPILNGLHHDYRRAARGARASVIGHATHGFFV